MIYYTILMVFLSLEKKNILEEDWITTSDTKK